MGKIKWLVGWFVGWFVDWLVACLVGWLIGWLIAWLVDCLVGAAETAAPPMRAAYGILSGGVRNLIGHRTRSDRVADAQR